LRKVNGSYFIRSLWKPESSKLERVSGFSSIAKREISWGIDNRVGKREISSFLA